MKVGNGSVELPYAEGDRRFFQGWQPVTKATGKDVEESRRVGRVIRAAAKRCWFNARIVVERLEEYALASYVEGWAVLANGMMIEHGWVVRGGTIIDPTLPDSVVAYFAGLVFQGKAGIREFLETPQGRECKKEPLFFAFGWGGGESPSYRGAQKHTRAFVERAFLRKD